MEWVDHPRFYARYLKSPHWKERRQRYYESHPYRCAACFTTKKLNLHHCEYDSLYNEPDSTLVYLCVRHHRAAHALHRRKRPYWTLRQATFRVVYATRAQAERNKIMRAEWRHPLRMLWKLIRL